MNARVLRLGNTFGFEKNAVCQCAVGKKPRYEHKQVFGTRITLVGTEVRDLRKPALQEIGMTNIFCSTCNVQWRLRQYKREAHLPGTSEGLLLVGFC